MDKIAILKMLAISEHPDIQVVINKKGYLIVSNKLENYNTHKDEINKILKANYNFIKENKITLSQKLLDFLNNNSYKKQLISNNIINYNIITVNVDYIINKILSKYSYRIYNNRILLEKEFKSSGELEANLALLKDKSESIVELLNKFSLYYTLIFSLKHKNITEDFVINCTGNNAVTSYALDLIDDDLIDIEGDIIRIGIKAIDEKYKAKKTAILSSKDMLLSDIYINFKDLEVKPCDYKGKFLDSLGETFINLGFYIEK